jgi:hypothetical protein
MLPRLGCDALMLSVKPYLRKPSQTAVAMSRTDPSTKSRRVFAMTPRLSTSGLVNARSSAMICSETSHTAATMQKKNVKERGYNSAHDGQMLTCLLVHTASLLFQHATAVRVLQQRGNVCVSIAFEGTCELLRRTVGAASAPCASKHLEQRQRDHRVT